MTIQFTLAVILLFFFLTYKMQSVLDLQNKLDENSFVVFDK